MSEKNMDIASIPRINSTTSNHSTHSIHSTNTSILKFSSPYSENIISKSKEPSITSSESSISSIDKSTNKAPKTTKQKIIKILKIIGLTILTIILLYTLLNFGCDIYEKAQLKNYDYGLHIDVNGHKMYVNIVGEQNEKTIIVLPGFGSASPVLLYKPLAEALADKYKVITFEPFGYGLSDIIDDERKVENIVSELHDGAKKLGLQKYYLMGHSIGGLYSLYWANEYNSEVLGFIGLDSTVVIAEERAESMASIIKYLSILDFLGLERMLSLFNSQNLFVSLNPTYNYIEEEIKMFRIITLQKGFNKLQRKEINTLNDNLNTMKAMKIPHNIPALNFLSSKNVESIKSWKDLHVEVGDEALSNEVIEITGDHINFPFTKRDEISEKIKSWIK